MYSRGILFSLLVGVCCQRIGRNIPQNQRGQKTVLPFRFWPLTLHCIFYPLVPSVLLDDLKGSLHRSSRSTINGLPSELLFRQAKTPKESPAVTKRSVALHNH